MPNLWNYLVFRFRKIYPAIAEGERSRIPDVLLETLLPTISKGEIGKVVEDILRTKQFSVISDGEQIRRYPLTIDDCKKTQD